MKQKFKALIERNRWIKAVPNSLTLCNSLCGFAAILYTGIQKKKVSKREKS